MGRPRKFPIDGQTEEEALDKAIEQRNNNVRELREELESIVQWLDGVGNGELARMPEEGPRIIAQNARVRAYNLRQFLRGI